jgi:hypothetical protein
MATGSAEPQREKSTLPGFEGWTIVAPSPELAQEPPFLLSPDGRGAVREDIAELAVLGQTRYNRPGAADDAAAEFVAGLEAGRIQRSRDGEAG